MALSIFLWGPLKGDACPRPSFELVGAAQLILAIASFVSILASYPNLEDVED